MYLDKDKILRYSEDDQCPKCSNKNNCPLLAALVLKMVKLNADELIASNCGMFKKCCLKVVEKGM